MNGSTRRTKIVATLGPASRDEATVDALIAAGMDVARLNMAHGSLDEHRTAIARVRAAAERHGRPVGILLDLPGPKLRLGDLPVDRMLAAGESVTLGEGGDLPVTFPELLAHLLPGQRVLLDDGAVELSVTEAAPARGLPVTLRVVNGGVVSSRKGVNLPGSRLPVPALTAHDEELLAFGLAEDVDLVALSFVRDPADVALLRRRVDEAGGDQLLVAKLEKREALERLDEILAVADAVMVARGDLGVEIPAAEVPIWQKRVIGLARARGRPVITATQMLQSMVAAPRPTRAEASDVANAIFDSTDAIMLSGETAVGAYPVQAVRTMADIALTVEADIVSAEPSDAAVGFRCGPAESSSPPTLSPGASQGEVAGEAIAAGARDVADAIGAAAIVTATFSGFMARAVARLRPAQPIVAVSPVLRTVRQLTLSWGVTPVSGARTNDLDALIAEASSGVLASGVAAHGEVVVLTAGTQAFEPGGTNLIKAHVLP